MSFKKWNGASLLPENSVLYYLNSAFSFVELVPKRNYAKNVNGTN